MKQYLVIGLGSFGLEVAKNLQKANLEVLAIDIKPHIVQEASKQLQNVVIADASNPDTLDKLGIKDFDIAIIGVGDIHISLMIILLLKDLGLKEIYVKANSKINGRILKKLGVTKVIYPERESAKLLSKELIMPDFIERLQLPGDFSVYEITALPWMINKNLLQLNLRKNYDISILLIQRENETIFPQADTIVKKNDKMIILTNQENLNKLKQTLKKYKAKDNNNKQKINENFITKILKSIFKI